MAAAHPKSLLLSNPVKENDGKVHQITGIESSTTSASSKPDLKLRASKTPESVEGHSLRTFTTPDRLTNLIIQVEDSKLFVHKEVLASWSPVFMAMFTDGFQESQAGMVTLTGKKLEDIVLLLNIIYPPNTHSITVENVLSILPLANEYNMETLKAKCELILSEFEPSSSLLAFAYLYGMPELLNKTIKKCAAQPFPTIDYKSSQNPALNDSILLQVYREKILMLMEQVEAVMDEKERCLKQYEEVLGWPGTGVNNYACRQHKKFNENCEKCLYAFRVHTLAILKKSAHSEKKRKLVCT